MLPHNPFSACWLNTGPEDQCVMDPVLWDSQWFCTSVQLDPCAQGTGGLWDWRSASVVSKYSCFKIFFSSFFSVERDADIEFCLLIY